MVAFVGRKHHAKGFPEFLAVAERLADDGRAVTILAVGAGPGRHSDEGFAGRRNALAVRGFYREWAPMPHAQLAELLKAVDVVVAPSHNETQGMVMIEAMAAGCITITTRVGGIPENVVHGVTGYLVDSPGDTERLYTLTAQALDNLAGLEKIRSAARNHAVAQLDWQIVTDRLSALYRQLLEER